jgi:hypothetical protein
MNNTYPVNEEMDGQIVLLVGTQKGLFRLSTNLQRNHWNFQGPLIAGYEIAHAWIDPRAPTYAYAAVNHPIWGSHLYRSHDSGCRWETLPRVPHHAKGIYNQPLKAIWYLAPGHPQDKKTLYAGIDPPGLFVSEDEGSNWRPLPGLNEHPTRKRWEPARGGFAVHSIYVDPRTPARLYCGISAGGVYRSEDAGTTWIPLNQGVRAKNLPQQYPELGHNVHRILLHPKQPDRLYRQCYNGTYRSDDRGEHWVKISAGLPSDFGYAIVANPQDPNTVYVIPEQSSQLRITVDGKLRVYRSYNAGVDWKALTCGLPQEHVYVTVLREAMDCDGLSPNGVYFGTSGGHLFASRNDGETWELIAGFLPRILSVKAAVVET